MSNFEQQAAKIRNQPGFIAALDQSGGSTPKALKLYGVEENTYSGEQQMMDLVHQMRTRIVSSPAFTGQRIAGAILFAYLLYYFETVEVGGERLAADRMAVRVAWLCGLAAAVTLVGGVGYGLMTREAPAAVEPPLALAAIPSPPPLAAAPPSAPSVVPAIPGADPALARKVAETLARYGRALESVDARLLAEARPDLGPHERRAILVRFEGSTNVATDLRVQNVVRRGAEATRSQTRQAGAGRRAPGK